MAPLFYTGTEPTNHCPMRVTIDCRCPCFPSWSGKDSEKTAELIIPVTSQCRGNMTHGVHLGSDDRKAPEGEKALPCSLIRMNFNLEHRRAVGRGGVGKLEQTRVLALLGRARRPFAFRLTLSHRPRLEHATDNCDGPIPLLTILLKSIASHHPQLYLFVYTFFFSIYVVLGFLQVRVPKNRVSGHFRWHWDICFRPQEGSHPREQPRKSQRFRPFHLRFFQSGCV